MLDRLAVFPVVMVLAALVVVAGGKVVEGVGRRRVIRAASYSVKPFTETRSRERTGQEVP